MAELVLKVGSTDINNSSLYQDGDILCAFNDRRIKQCHAEMICHPWKPENRAENSLAQFFLEKTHKYRFERVSRTEIKRVDIATGNFETISNIPNSEGEYMDVSLFIAKRKSHKALDGKSKLPIFGSEGKEIWYGGTKIFSNVILDEVWNEIEDRTSFLKSNFTKWPLTSQELKSFLCMEVDNFTDLVASDLVSGETEEFEDERGKIATRILKRRRHKIDWRALSPIDISPKVTETDIDDKAKEIDIRSKMFNRRNIVETKI